MRTFRYVSLLVLLAFLGVEVFHVLPVLHAFQQARLAEQVSHPMHVTQAGAAMEIVAGFVTAPGATLTAWTLAAGSSLQIRNCDFNKAVRLLQFWADQQALGAIRIRSPKMHDNVQGVRVTTTASDVVPLNPLGLSQRLYPQDILTVEQSGSATAGDIESGVMLIHYEDLPGSSARFITNDQLMKRGVNEIGVRSALALGTAGGYSGEVAINATDDLFKANTDYALVGYVVDVECAVVRWRGADTGNYGVGGPGNETLRHVTANWFMRLSALHALPLIPVFNSANKQGILIDGVQDENGADTNVSSLFVELAPA